MTKEFPILFSTPMVQAILRGEKTQTRQIILFPHNETDKDVPKLYQVDAEGQFCFYSPGVDAPMLRLKPRYRPGDILWVRETWRETGVKAEPYAYRADEPEPLLVNENGDVIQWRWKPSIYMPRKAARIFLRVADVSAERLQDITPYEAFCEGIRFEVPDNFKRQGASYPLAFNEWSRERQAYWFKFAFNKNSEDFVFMNRHISEYLNLWDSLNAKRGYGCSTNPWVWCVEFERHVIIQRGRSYPS
jgi:hypothetical protein